MRSIPDDFARRMVEMYEAEGEAWLRRLPGLIDACARCWSLTVEPPITPLSYNYVAPAVRADGTRAILKVGFPHQELMTEIEALRLYDGHGIARLLEGDRDWGALLLERLEPGVPLSALEDDEEATSIAARVMQALWRPAPAEHPFPTVARWARGLERLRRRFDGGTGPLPAALVEQAEGLFRDLLATSSETVLLHGDLHHDNILTAEREPWLAIDPKGLVGDPGYELGAFLYNPLPRLLERPNPDRVLARRVDQLSELLGIDRARVRGWGVAQAVLSAWWSIEDHGHGWEPAIRCSELLANA